VNVLVSEVKAIIRIPPAHRSGTWQGPICVLASNRSNANCYFAAGIVEHVVMFAVNVNSATLEHVVQSHHNYAK
jgi:hypothetical protein